MNLFADTKFKILTKTERAAAMLQIRADMNKLATPFEDDTPKKQKERIARSRTDHFYFFKTYLPHYFPSEPCELHKTEVEWLEIRGKPGVLAAPRGFAKSTTVFGYIIHQGCFGLRKYATLYSGIKDLSEMQVECMMVEFEENPRIKHDFGDLRDLSWWTKDLIALKTGCAIEALGPNSRGVKFKASRPDLQIVDDLENDINVRNPKFVQRQLDWLLKAVMPSGQGGGDDCSFLLIGTILKRKSVLSILLTDEEFDNYNRRKFQAIEKGKALWSAVYPLEKLARIKANIKSRAFASEYMNNPRDDENGIKEGWIRYYIKSDLDKFDLYTETGVDPSHKSEEIHDPKAIITVSRDRRSGDYYVRNAFIRRCTTNKLVEAVYTVDEQFNPSVINLETVGGQVLLHDVFELTRQLKKLHKLPIRGKDSQRGEKITRIMDGLSSLLEFGKIKFLKGDSDQDLLIEQLLDLLDESVNDDGPDALEIVTSSMKNRYKKFEYKSVSKRRSRFGNGSY